MLQSSKLLHSWRKHFSTIYNECLDKGSESSHQLFETLYTYSKCISIPLYTHTAVYVVQNPYVCMILSCFSGHQKCLVIESSIFLIEMIKVYKNCYVEVEHENIINIFFSIFYPDICLILTSFNEIKNVKQFYAKLQVCCSWLLYLTQL